MMGWGVSLMKLREEMRMVRIIGAGERLEDVVEPLPLQQ